MSAAAVRQARRWYLQRISAMVLVVCVVVHLGLVIHAVRGTLTGADILARTRGSVAFGVFYAIFVLASALHVPAGLATVAIEWLRWPELRAFWAARLIALLLVVTGLYAVASVVLP